MKAIYCDVCGQLVDISKENGMGTFQYFEKKTSLVALQNGDNEPQITKVELDLCLNCCKNVENMLVEVHTEATKNAKSQGN
jgi:hypothetical protein